MTSSPWVQWRNFRGFDNTGRIELCPITIVIGPNNSGKSSLYKPLLLLRQTAETSREKPGLVTRGDLINAGSFEDLVPLGDADTVIQCTLGLRSRRRESRELEHVGHYAPGELSVQFVKGSPEDDVSLKQVVVRDVYGRTMFLRSRLESGRFSLRLKVDTPEDEPRSDFDKAVVRVVRDSQPEHFLFSGTAAFSEALTSRDHSDDSDGQPSSSGIELSSRTVQYLRAADFIHDRVRQFLSSLHYLGPLRDFPRRVYEVSGETPDSVGVLGQYAPELLFRGEPTGLRSRVNDSLRSFDLDADLVAEQVADGLFMLGLNRKGWARPINIADLGFGISQLLPLVVQGLLLNKGEYLVAEQPEIHLNPRLQARLADFFVDLAKSGRRVLAETHSEHLLLRLRRRIAAGDIDAEDVGVQFVEMEAGKSTVRRVPLDSFGHIESGAWPKGFFEESLGEALALAAAQSDRRRSGAN